MGSDMAHERRRSAAPAVVRPVRREDAEAINAIRRQPGVMDNTLGLASERIADNHRFLDALGPDDHVLVAEVDGQVVGLAGLHVRRGKLRHTAELGLSVATEHQGRGIGRQLTAALLDIADNQLALVRVELDVLADNVPAIRLYESLGFEHEGRKRKALVRGGQHVDILLMGRVRNG